VSFELCAKFLASRGPFVVQAAEVRFPWLKVMLVPQSGGDEIWQEVKSTASELRQGQEVSSTPRLFQLNRIALERILGTAPREGTSGLADSPAILSLPMPNGTLARFRIEESPVMEPEMASQFPEIKSYRGQGIDDPVLTTRVDWSPLGLHALILNSSQTVNVYPANNLASTAGSAIYASGVGGQIQAGEAQCLVQEIHQIRPGRAEAFAPNVAIGPTLRTYRIAIAATWEYCNAYGGGTNAGTVASINTWLNGVNAIYERELSLHLNLVGNTNILYSSERGFTANTDPFTNSDVGTMLNEVRPVLRDQVGQANYDLGHVLGQIGFTGGAGVAFIGVVCDNTNQSSLGPLKGGGATIVGGTVGNSTALGVFAHELGHQVGATHSFNGTTNGCAPPNRSPSSAWEPGGGSTMMAYPGICDADNVTNTRDMRFHNGSFQQITSYVFNTGSTGNSCGTPTATGNNIPTVNGGPDYSIPKQTPFTLTAAGSDPDAADVPNLTYVWEQLDAGGTNYANPPYNDGGDPATTTRPLFRAFPPSTSPSRTFPSLTYILKNANDPPDVVGGFQSAEELPRVGRTLNFRVTVRDNRSGGGGVNDDTVMLTVAGGAGPFAVTSPEAAVIWTGGTVQTVTWSVNGTNAAPVNCANVKISLSSDGGNTFPYVLAASTPNDGSEIVTVPVGINTSAARIKVEAVGNIFFDISGVNFTLTPGSCSFLINPTSQNFAASGGNGSVSVTAAAGCAWTVISNAGWITITGGASGSGDGAVNYTVAANTTGAQRTGTITIAGQIFTVTQDGNNCPAITVNPTSLPDGTVGASYSQTVTASGGTPAYSFTVSAGALPGGLTLSSNGALAGTPNTAGTFNFTIKATDATGCTGTRTYTVFISGVGLMFYPLPRPIRLMDTRAGQGNCDNVSTPIAAGTSLTTLARTTCEGITIPANAQAIVGNLTAINQSTQAGYLTIYPDGQPVPLASNMIYPPGQIIANNFTVALGSNGKFDVFAERTIDVVVDISGYFAPPGAGGLYYHPLA
jgi:hypothetical protein